jgi:hypothetical protein
MAHGEPPVYDLMRQLARESADVLTEQEFLARIIERDGAIGVEDHRHVLAALRGDALHYGWVALSASLYVPHRVVIDGATLRCRPTVTEVRDGLLNAEHFFPFLTADQLKSSELRDRRRALLPLRWLARSGGAALQLTEWYRWADYRSGDSILVRINLESGRIVLELRHEPATDWRVEPSRDADRGLAACLLQTVADGELNGRPRRMILLAGHYLFAGRSGYPGTPYGQLAEQYGLLRALTPVNADEALLQLEDRLERRMHEARERVQALAARSEAARRADRQAGIWDGAFRSAIAERLSRINWSAAAEPPLSGGTDTDGEVAQRLAEPQLRQRVLQALPPEAAADLRRADAQQTERIVLGHLNYLLSRDRSLFPLLEPIPMAERLRHLDQLAVAELADSDDDADDTTAALFGDADVGLRAPFADDEDDDDDEDFAESIDLYELARDSSYALITDYANHLLESGRSERNATQHVTALLGLADYLADTFALSIESADYATLDEYLFLYYPAYVAPFRTARRIEQEIRLLCTALRQCFAYLRTTGRVDDVRFVLAIWRRRAEAAAHSTLVRELRGNPPFSTLIPLLFDVYTR